EQLQNRETVRFKISDFGSEMGFRPISSFPVPCPVRLLEYVISLTRRAFACLFVAVTLLGQAPTFEGMWYGTINPPGLQFDIAVRFQKTGDSWSGTLLLENGMTAPLSEIAAQSKSISFSADARQNKIAFKGALSDNGTEISGQFMQENATFPFKLSRTSTE